ncbi:MAG: serine hydrolase domain-containing protein [Myxococcota bacterium]|nr:serine hydrolase domain-containing protein [Myxococcota bacterium]
MKRAVFITTAFFVLTRLFSGCGTPAPPPATPEVVPEEATHHADVESKFSQEPVGEQLTADTPKTTIEGNAFIAPKGWRMMIRGPATMLTPPEGDSTIALIDLHATTAKKAVEKAWKIYKPDAKWPLLTVNKAPDSDGWEDRSSYTYQTSPNEKRYVIADIQRANDVWTVVIVDMASAVLGKRLAQVVLIFDDLLPKGYTRESFAGKKPHPLDKARIAKLTEFIETGMKETRVPGVALGLIQDGKVVFAGGFGVRELGKKKKVNANTLFMIASNTKALTSLLLAKLVDEKKLTWETPVTRLLPSFKLGDADTTSQVKVKHLVCACTGLPRQDYEWIFQYEGVTPEDALATLATMQPTSGFGEMFQYSNPMVGAGGFVGGHVAFSKLDLGAAYDKAMQTRVFDPLKMRSTTFNYAKALRGNVAIPHASDIDGNQAHAEMAINYAVIPVRPAGAAWSNVRDMLAYIAMELAEGSTPGGKQYVSKEALLARRTPQVTIGKYETYGMGLMVNTTYGTPVVHHGGDLPGFHSDMMWLPEHGVGAVVLTNGDPGWLLRTLFRRKLLEVLFDGRAEADKKLAAWAKNYYDRLVSERKLLTLPADSSEAEKLAPRYTNDALGEIAISRNDGKTIFDFGEWKSEMASRKNPDGTISFHTTKPGVLGFEFVVGSGDKRILITRDAQHEYIFSED